MAQQEKTIEQVLEQYLDEQERGLPPLSAVVTDTPGQEGSFEPPTAGFWGTPGVPPTASWSGMPGPANVQQLRQAGQLEHREGPRPDVAKDEPAAGVEKAVVQADQLTQATGCRHPHPAQVEQEGTRAQAGVLAVGERPGHQGCRPLEVEEGGDDGE
jgi:hypothetical protein